MLIQKKKFGFSWELFLTKLFFNVCVRFYRKILDSLEILESQNHPSFPIKVDATRLKGFWLKKQTNKQTHKQRLQLHIYRYMSEELFFIDIVFFMVLHNKLYNILSFTPLWIILWFVRKVACDLIKLLIDVKRKVFLPIIIIRK